MVVVFAVQLCVCADRRQRGPDRTLSTWKQEEMHSLDKWMSSFNCGLVGPYYTDDAGWDP